ncbi:LTA synthase family protein [Paenibacillus ginsengarvi]|uniref:LTA synthase family protein n=2 Tax=Paenibacillus ginsengarvi TaxID=400777 RepID=A0A3B0C4H0_9BACL|nr:LTA synthase family protein [Paenibacillus ginsengarvi]
MILLSGWLVLFMEALSRNRTWDAVVWSVLHIPALLLNGAIIFGVLLTLVALTGRPRLSFWIVSAIGFVFALITGVKSKMLGIPLLPWDFVLTGEASGMVEYLKNIFTMQLFLDVIVFTFVSWLLLYKTDHLIKVVRWKERIAFAAAAAALIAVLYTDKPFPIKSAFGINAIMYDQSANVDINGWLLATILNIDYMGIDELENYNQESIAAIVSNVTPIGGGGVTEGVKPNIIVVLSESLWDPTQLGTVKFNSDPMPFLHELQQKTATGTLLSPQFGGGTANVEFEVLTGNSMRFLPQGTIPYNQYVTHEIDSLASITARSGYYSTAISPFHRWYFNADKVYQNFGFAQYIPLEFFDPVYEGPYIADNEVAKLIIQQTGRTKERDFVFANTMENHFHYYPGKFEENPFTVEGDIPIDTKGMLETYAKGANDADKMLRTLVEHYETSEEPTIVVFFGDHLPYLGDEYKAYKDTKWISGDNDPDFANKIYRTPVVVWSNYLPQTKETINLSPSFLGSYVLEKANVPGSYYTDFLRQLSRRSPTVPPYSFDMKRADDVWKQYELLQYDIMFGDQHAYGEMEQPIVNPNYFLGFGPMVIDQVSPDSVKAGGEAEITIAGKNFPALAKVYANGKPVETNRGPNGELTAKLPGELLRSGTCQLQVKVLDSKDIVVGHSNVKSIQVMRK